MKMRKNQLITAGFLLLVFLSVASVSAASTITVTSPNGGETWQRGTTHTVTWDYSGDPGPSVKITRLQGGIEVGTISSSTSSGTSGHGSFTWVISSTGSTGSDNKVKVQSISQPYINDTSNNNFTLYPVTPPGPTYVYYTPVMYPTKSKNIMGVESLTNVGDSVADACYYKYFKNGSQLWELHTSRCITIPPGEVRSCTPTIVMPYFYAYRFKVTTTSKFVVPFAQFLHNDGDVIYTYLPGDFHQVEI